MGNTWIVDIRHYLEPSGALAATPSRARLLAEYFISIVVDATTNLEEDPASGATGAADGAVAPVPSCRIRLLDDLARNLLVLPICNDNGLLSGWQNTMWDELAHETAH